MSSEKVWRPNPWANGRQPRAASAATIDKNDDKSDWRAKIVAYSRLPALTVAAGCARKLSPAEAPGCGCKYVCLRGRSPWADTQGVDARICYECPERPPLDDA